jgi:hypothetical protein
MRDLSHFFFHHAERGASCSIEIPALEHHGDAQEVVEHDVVVKGLPEVERNLCGHPHMRM